MDNYTLINKTLNASKDVESIKVSVEVSKCEGKINITDVMLQSGDTSLSWNGHPSEMKWVVDN